MLVVAVFPGAAFVGVVLGAMTLARTALAAAVACGMLGDAGRLAVRAEAAGLAGAGRVRGAAAFADPRLAAAVGRDVPCAPPDLRAAFAFAVVGLPAGAFAADGLTFAAADLAGAFFRAETLPTAFFAAPLGGVAFAVVLALPVPARLAAAEPLTRFAGADRVSLFAGLAVVLRPADVEVALAAERPVRVAAAVGLGLGRDVCAGLAARPVPGLVAAEPRTGALAAGLARVPAAREAPLRVVVLVPVDLPAVADLVRAVAFAGAALAAGALRGLLVEEELWSVRRVIVLTVSRWGARQRAVLEAPSIRGRPVSGTGDGA